MTSSSVTRGGVVDGSYPNTLTPDHLNDIRHKRCMAKFLAMSQEETMLIAFKKPGCATAVGHIIADIALRRLLPGDVENLLLLLVGVKKKAPASDEKKPAATTSTSAAATTTNAALTAAGCRKK